MEVTGLDFVLINILSYVAGVATGLIVCCKNKDKLLVKSRSLEQLSLQQMNSEQMNSQQQTPYSSQPVVASAPLPDKPVKITVE
tara:strand:+ start:1183 stop:1434 length:252 start_codon:yes stop_codon:yes gene_type:complete